MLLPRSSHTAQSCFSAELSWPVEVCAALMLLLLPSHLFPSPVASVSCFPKG
ncbi:hypothetical protein I79_015530 [Cricetulus griseus]|uniref:Uncharacterized protein n=1 Tax=Cricetulus griseus TaxID=10029 RepID=G3HX15_CRIGR|nr:hypothetical protein I79_015530 [Cricetulus griseus]